jgi:mRNA-degrading endonuclease RelE of RelBE toxin-antitoxin system
VKLFTEVEKEIFKEIRNLPFQYQQKILDVVQLLKRGIEATPKKHNITELKGCGKKIWKGIDAQKYVDKLRKEWD